MDSSISCWRAMRASHQSLCVSAASAGQSSDACRGICHSSQSQSNLAFKSSRNGSSVSCHCSQMTSISVLFPIDFRVMCETRW